MAVKRKEALFARVLLCSGLGVILVHTQGLGTCALRELQWIAFWEGNNQPMRLVVWWKPVITKADQIHGMCL